MIGRTISHYEVIEKLGQGGMGVVYKARDTRLNRPVAIKILPAESVSDPDRRRRFVLEAKAASALNHPNIVTIHDLDSTGDLHFIVMEYVAGKTLDRLMGTKGIKLSSALGYTVQIADALSKAHAVGIIHRDLKPSNIMITEDGTVKVLDFGLAKLIEPTEADSETATALTEAGIIVGTAAYMSPEQAEGKKVDTRSDIFSFGSVVYEMITGSRAFPGDTRASTIASIVRDEPRPPREIIDDLPQEVERAVLRCLRKDPQRRWQSMADLMTVLQDLKEESDSGKLAGAAPTAPARSGHSMWLLLAAGLVMAVASFSIWQRFHPTGALVQPEIARLTTDSGLTMDPAISTDGKLVAYASDRGDGSNLDIWVKQIAGRDPIQRTRHEADDRQPHFSPDGSLIAFRSERDAGGIYVMGALSGEERRIVDSGFDPRFSPDGAWILYREQPASSDTRLNKMYLVPSQGGTSRAFQPEFGAVQAPIWSPDGKHILFDGVRGKENGWWVAPFDGGPAVSTGLPKFSDDFGGSFFFPCAWVRDQILFTRGSAVEGLNLYRTTISRDSWKVSDQYQVLTAGQGMRYGVATTNEGRVLFANLNIQMNLVAVALDPSTGAASGEPRNIAQDGTTKAFPAISRDGTRICYIAYAGSQPPRVEVRVRDIKTDKETIFAGSSPVFPRLSGDGARLAFRDLGQKFAGSYLVTDFSGTPRQICENCMILDFFSNPDEALVRYGRNRLLRQHLIQGGQSEILNAAGGAIEDAHLSHDDRWVTFLLTKSSGISAICVAPLTGTRAPEQEWITIAEDSRYLGSPRWSPDGNLIYYLSERDGHCCVWARQLEAKDKKPFGAPLGIYHEHRPRYALLPSAPKAPRAIGVAKDKLLMYQINTTSNIWQLLLPLK
jgi:Tol biopolymer transport system component/tRNA A-37 threonylcarbamoyl transferase component Bud32